MPRTLRPIRVLELRSVSGTGGGPEKTILLGAARSDPARVAVTVCYVRDARDNVFGIDARARSLPVSYVEVRERHSFDVRVWSELRALIRDRDIDLVHAHDYKTDLLGLLLAKAARIVALATVHGWTGHSPRERRLYYPLDKRVLSRYPRLIAVSGEIRDELIRTGTPADRITVVLNGIDPDAFRRDPSRENAARRDLDLPPDALVLGAVGRLEPQKRFDLVLEAVARLRSRYPALILLIAGDGGLRRQLEADVVRLGLSSVCRLLGHVSDVIGLHHALDLFVQASDYEGTSNAVLEAMALETPIIATSAGGTEEQITDGVHGLVVPCGNPDALTAALDRALADRDATRRRAHEARLRVEGPLSFGMRMAHVERVYEELVLAGPRGGRDLTPMSGAAAL